MATPDRKWRPVGGSGLKVSAFVSKGITDFNIIRSYLSKKDNKEEWKDTTFFRVGDLLALQAIIPELIKYAQEQADGKKPAPQKQSFSNPESYTMPKSDRFDDDEAIPF